MIGPVIKLLRPAPWMAQGACRGANPNVFHPRQGESLAPARATCAECKVRTECLDYAIDDPTLSGVWGGTSERERRTIRKRIRAVTAPVRSESGAA